MVYDRIDFVQKLLAAAALEGPEAVSDIRAALYASVTSGLRMGGLGEPLAEDVEMRDCSLRIAATRIGGL